MGREEEISLGFGNQHLPKEKNQACDDLSREFKGDVNALRKRSVEDNKLQVTDPERRYSHDHSKVGDRSKCLEFNTFMNICNPKQTWETEEEFGLFWSRMVGWCNRVLGAPPPA
jgi:hypothetical protein